MPSIQNDQQFKAALSGLGLAQQRAIAALFVESVQALSSDARVQHAIDLAKNPDTTADQLEQARRTVKAYVVQTYTSCGNDVDWAGQAEHFVGTAALACLTAEDRIKPESNIAWRSAMQARMANNCQMLSSDSGEMPSEAEKQYVITDKFLAA